LRSSCSCLPRSRPRRQSLSTLLSHPFDAEGRLFAGSIVGFREAGIWQRRAEVLYYQYG
jgi:hypothetical protein